MTPAIGSLCTGYGGLDAAVRDIFGGELAWWSDVDPGPIKVMTHHHPNVPNLGDLKVIDWSAVSPIDILTAGFPCQPFSNAGKRLGTDDPRHLWPWIKQGIGVLRPRLVVLENVSGHLRRGFDVVSADLADLGYDATWSVVSAASVGAPHLRKRLFIVAEDTHSAVGGERWQPAPGQTQGGWAWSDAGGRSGVATADSDRGEVRDQSVAEQRSGDSTRAGRDHASVADTDGDKREWEPAEQSGRTATAGRSDSAPNTVRERLEVHSELNGQTVAGEDGELRQHFDGRSGASFPSDQDWVQYTAAIRRWERVTGRVAPAPTMVSTRGGRVLSPRFVEFMMGLPAGHVTDVEGLSRNEKLKLLGNGVVPQQAEYAIRGLLAATSVLGVAA